MTCPPCRDHGVTLKLDNRQRYVAQWCPHCQKGMLELMREAKELGVDTKALIEKAREVEA